MRTRLPLALAAVLALTACPACDSTSLFKGNPEEQQPADSEFVESPKPLKDVDLDGLWAGSEHVLSREGLQIDRDRTRYDEREMTTHWITLLAPNRYEGRRTRAVIRFRQNDDKDWIIGVAVVAQRNAEMDVPSNEANAKWEPTAAKTDKAAVLLWKLEAGFREHGGDADEKNEKKK